MRFTTFCRGVASSAVRVSHVAAQPAGVTGSGGVSPGVRRRGRRIARERPTCGEGVECALDVRGRVLARPAATGRPSRRCRPSREDSRSIRVPPLPRSAAGREFGFGMGAAGRGIGFVAVAWRGATPPKAGTPPPPPYSQRESGENFFLPRWGGGREGEGWRENFFRKIEFSY